jgi:phage repressor protein C with HTH and peptisase S24 domain
MDELFARQRTKVNEHFVQTGPPPPSHFRGMTNVPAALRALRARSGLSIRKLASLIDMPPTTYAYYEDGFKEDYLPVPLARQLAKAVAGLGAPPIEEREVMALTGAAMAPPNAEPAAVEVPRPNQMPLDVPVYGVAVGGDAGDFSLNGDVVDRVRRPPGLVGNRNAFAVYVRGDSMEPRHYQGDLLYVDPIRPARSGDDVLVELKPARPGEPGPAYIKQLVTQGPVRVVLRQFNPAKDITLPGAQILRVSKILKLADLLGI